jgi:thiol-disulfide isomerase/thioredoxin
MVAAMSTAGFAQNEIGPGSPAPKLEVAKWYKGEPVTDISKGIVIVEFWATWCGPCRTSIPHITEVGKKNPDVRILGISIWEEDSDKIPAFVKEMGDKMDYTVGWSSNQEGMAVSWMKAAAQNGIPASFILKDGIIQWVGHPMELEQPLADVKSGKFDLAASKAAFDKEAAETRAQMVINEEFGKVTALRKAGKKEEANDAMANFEAKYPDRKGMASLTKFVWLSEDDPKAWDKEAVKLSKLGDEGLSQLCSFSIRALQAKNTNGARRAIDLVMANAKKDDLNAASYAAYVYEQLNDKPKALKANKALLAALPADKQFDEARERAKKKIQELGG